MPRAAAPELSRRLGRALGPLAAAWLLVFASSGCATSSAVTERELHPSSLEVVGHILWVDRSDNTAIVQVRRGTSVGAQPLIARNEVLVETARLRPTDMRQGNTVGMRILDGLPNVGDEVARPRARNGNGG